MKKLIIGLLFLSTSAFSADLRMNPFTKTFDYFQSTATLSSDFLLLNGGNFMTGQFQTESSATVKGDLGVGGDADITGSATIKGADGLLVDYEVKAGSANITAETTVGGQLTVNSAVKFHSQTQAQIEVYDPITVGEMFYCSDCTATTLCISTGTVVGDFSTIQDPTSACD